MWLNAVELAAPTTHNGQSVHANHNLNCKGTRPTSNLSAALSIIQPTDQLNSIQLISKQILHKTPRCKSQKKACASELPLTTGRFQGREVHVINLRSGCGDRSILCGPQTLAGRKRLRRRYTVYTTIKL